MPGDAMREETEASWRADTLSGTPEQVIERVLAFEAIGVEEIVVAPWVLPFAVPEPELVDLFAERVLARFRGVACRVVTHAVRCARCSRRRCSKKPRSPCIGR